MPLSVLRGWNEHDRLLAQALTVFEAMVHSGCGHPLWESLDPDNEGRYIVEAPSRCHACDAIAVKAEAHANAGAPRMHAVLWSATLRPQPPPAEADPGPTLPG